MDKQLKRISLRKKLPAAVICLCFSAVWFGIAVPVMRLPHPDLLDCFFFALAAGLLAAGILQIALPCAGYYQRSVRAYCRAQANAADARRKVEAAYAQAPQASGLWLHEDFILLQNDAETRLIPAKDLTRLYAEAKFYGGRELYALRFVRESGVKEKPFFMPQDRVLPALQRAAELYPRAAVQKGEPPHAQRRGMEVLFAPAPPKKKAKRSKKKNA